MKINVFGDFCCNDASRLHFDDTMTDLLKSSDINVVNFEAPIRTKCSQPIIKSGPLLSQDCKSPSFLEKNNFNVISMANNHIMDYGEDSLRLTMESFHDSLICGVGTFQEAYSVKKKVVENQTVGFLSLVQYEFGVHNESSQVNRRIGSAWMLHPCVDEIIVKAKEECDFLFILPHAGLEFFQLPLPEIRTLYRHFINMGADAVIASHPHVPQNWEIYKDKPIVYSLGNFCFDDECTDKLWYYGLCACLDIESKQIELDVKILHYNREQGVVRFDDDKSIIESLQKMNEIFKNDDCYYSVINSKCLEMESVYDKMLEYSGYFRPKIKIYFRLILGMLKRKIFGLPLQSFELSHYVNNMRCETHRWVQSRIYELSK